MTGASPAGRSAPPDPPRPLRPWVLGVAIASGLAAALTLAPYGDVVVPGAVGFHPRLDGGDSPFHGAWIRALFALGIAPSLARAYVPRGTRPRPAWAVLTATLCFALAAFAAWDAFHLPSDVPAETIHGGRALELGFGPAAYRFEPNPVASIVAALGLVSVLAAVGYVRACAFLRDVTREADRRALGA